MGSKNKYIMGEGKKYISEGRWGIGVWDQNVNPYKKVIHTYKDREIILNAKNATQTPELTLICERKALPRP